MPENVPPPSAEPRLSPQERRRGREERLAALRLRMAIGRELDERGIAEPAAVGAALGMPPAEATKLLSSGAARGRGPRLSQGGREPRQAWRPAARRRSSNLTRVKLKLTETRKHEVTGKGVAPLTVRGYMVMGEDALLKRLRRSARRRGRNDAGGGSSAGAGGPVCRAPGLPGHGASMGRRAPGRLGGRGDLGGGAAQGGAAGARRPAGRRGVAPRGATGPLPRAGRGGVRRAILSRDRRPRLPTCRPVRPAGGGRSVVWSGSRP